MAHKISRVLFSAISQISPSIDNGSGLGKEEEEGKEEIVDNVSWKSSIAKKKKSRIIQVLKNKPRNTQTGQASANSTIAHKKGSIIASGSQSVIK